MNASLHLDMSEMTLLQLSQSPFRRGDEGKLDVGFFSPYQSNKSQSPFRRGDECKRRNEPRNREFVFDGLNPLSGGAMNASEGLYETLDNQTNEVSIPFQAGR